LYNVYALSKFDYKLEDIYYKLQVKED